MYILGLYALVVAVGVTEVIAVLDNKEAISCEVLFVVEVVKP